MPPPPVRGGARFFRPPGPTTGGRAGYRAAGGLFLTHRTGVVSSGDRVTGNQYL